MRLESFFENFELLAEAPNGVQKLRELVLQLAVQGKLVAQDSRDEPAQDLVVRAKAKRDALADEQGWRKAQVVRPLTALDAPFQVPKQWIWCRIGEFAFVRGGKRIPKGYTYSNTPTPYIYIRVSDMKDGTIIANDLQYITEHVYQQIKQYTIDKDDLYVTIAGTIGQVGEVPDMFHRMNLTENAAKLVFREIDKKYLKLALNSDFIKEQFRERTNQQAQPKLALKRIADSVVPLPPVEEQKRIVAKVDELMALCDKLEQRQRKRNQARALLNNASLNALTTSESGPEFNTHWRRVTENFHHLYTSREAVNELRLAILQLAVQGKLVPQDPKDEPAAKLLEGLREHIMATAPDREVKKMMALLEAEAGEKPFSLPESWQWQRLGSISKAIDYGTSVKASDVEVGIPIFRMNNIQDGKVVLANLKYVPPNINDLPRLYLVHNDILFNRTNSYELVGKTGIFRGEGEAFTFASYLIRVTLFQDFVEPRFINLAMNASYYRLTQLEPEITQQTGQANFNGTKLKNTLIPLPPLAEQKRIVAKVDQLMVLCDELEAKLERADSDSQKLVEAVVHWLEAA